MWYVRYRWLDSRSPEPRTRIVRAIRPYESTCGLYVISARTITSASTAIAA